MDNVKIILFNGPKRTGKDTAADLCIKHVRVIQKVNAVKLKFADALKRATHESNGL